MQILIQIENKTFRVNSEPIKDAGKSISKAHPRFKPWHLLTLVVYIQRGLSSAKKQQEKFLALLSLGMKSNFVFFGYFMSLFTRRIFPHSHHVNERRHQKLTSSFSQGPRDWKLVQANLESRWGLKFFPSFQPKKKKFAYSQLMPTVSYWKSIFSIIGHKQIRIAYQVSITFQACIWFIVDINSFSRICQEEVSHLNVPKSREIQVRHQEMTLLSQLCEWKQKSVKN